MNEDLRPRVEKLENWRIEMDIARAREDENRRHMDGRFDRIERELTAMSGWVKKGLSVVGILVATRQFSDTLTAFVKFVLDGGLNG